MFKKGPSWNSRDENYNVGDEKTKTKTLDVIAARWDIQRSHVSGTGDFAMGNSPEGKEEPLQTGRAARQARREAASRSRVCTQPRSPEERGKEGNGQLF